MWRSPASRCEWRLRACGSVHRERLLACGGMTRHRDIVETGKCQLALQKPQLIARAEPRQKDAFALRAPPVGLPPRSGESDTEQWVETGQSGGDNRPLRCLQAAIPVSSLETHASAHLRREFDDVEAGRHTCEPYMPGLRHIANVRLTAVGYPVIRSGPLKPMAV